MIVTSTEIPAFEHAGTVTAGLATRSLGASETGIWRLRIEPNGRVAPHFHDREEIAVIVAGSGIVIEAGTARCFSPGDVVIIPRNTVHELLADGCGGVDCISALPLEARHFTALGEEMRLPWAH